MYALEADILRGKRVQKSICMNSGLITPAPTIFDMVDLTKRTNSAGTGSSLALLLLGLEKKVPFFYL